MRWFPQRQIDVTSFNQSKGSRQCSPNLPAQHINSYSRVIHRWSFIGKAKRFNPFCGVKTVLSKNSNEANSCGFSIIVAQQTAESLARTDGAAIWKFRELWLDGFVLQALVGFVRCDNAKRIERQHDVTRVLRRRSFAPRRILSCSERTFLRKRSNWEIEPEVATARLRRS